MSRAQLIRLLVAAVLAALVAVPWIGSFFAVFVMTEVLIMGLFAISFNLLFGYTGLLSFGHAGFFGAGAYTAALLLRDVGPAFIWALLAAPLVAGALALVIGFFCVRLHEVYFAMLTLAFGMMVYSVVHQWRSYTNGSDGVAGFPLTGLAPGLSFSLAHPFHYYWLTLAVVALAGYLLYRITISPFGLILRAIRENTERVAFARIPVFRYRLYAFALSGAFSGLAGALYAPFNRIAVPDMAHWTQSAEPVLMSVLGGASYFLGPFVGSAVFVILEHWITSYTDEWMLYLGIVLGLIVVFFPSGVLGVAQRWLGGRS